MAKADVDKQAILEKENAELRAKITEQEQAIDGRYSIQKEISKLRATQKGKNPIGQIGVKRWNDHKNIPLWTRDGQMIGPLHPANAEQFLYEMAAQGVVLTVEKPTVEEVEAYKQTPEYKKIQEWEAKRRAGKNKSRKAGQIEKLAERIAEMSGKKIEEIHNVIVKK